MPLNQITVKFDEVFSNEYFTCGGFEYQRANCGPYDKKRKAYNEDADEWFTFDGRDKVLVWRS
jgi:hypothetical protein